MFPALGEGTSSNPVDLYPVPGQPQTMKGRKRKHAHGDSTGQDFEAGINLLGNTLASRFLFAALKVEFYKKNRKRFETLMDTWGKWMQQMFEEGFSYNGETWRILVLGLSGDAPFLREAGFHNRSFSNVSKSASATTVLKGVCWLCDAGRTGGPNFEDPDILNAAWVSTTGINNPLPWDDEPGPLLQHLLANQNDLASFYLPDIFHIYHFGVGKDFVASSLIYLIKTAFKKNNMAVSMDAFNARLQAHFLQHKSDRCHFGKTMTFDLLGYSSSKDYPTGHWSKGADTASLCKVVECITGEVLVASADLCDDWILKTILAAATAIGNFFRVVFRSPYKLKPDDAQSAILDVYRFCRLYVLLAHRCLTQKLCLFKVKPKA